MTLDIRLSQVKQVPSRVGTVWAVPSPYYEIAEGVSRGMTTDGIATRLGQTEGSVRSETSWLYSTLGIATVDANPRVLLARLMWEGRIRRLNE